MQIDTRILTTCVFLGEWPLSKVFLKNQSNYPWLILVPKVENISEIYQLTSQMQHQLMDEIKAASIILEKLLQPTKLNIGSLGNIVSQLHIHVIARFEHDDLWPHGIWQENMKSKPYHADELSVWVEKYKQQVAQFFQMA